MTEIKELNEFIVNLYIVKITEPIIYIAKDMDDLYKRLKEENIFDRVTEIRLIDKGCIATEKAVEDLRKFNEFILEV